MSGLILATHPEKGMVALLHSDGRLWIAIAFEPAEVGDSFSGEVHAPGEAELYNTTRQRRLRVFATNGSATRETLWRDLLFGCVEEFEAANPSVTS